MGTKNTFEWALSQMRGGFFVKRAGWHGIKAGIQFPDENSKMTEPYIYMQKGSKCFPLDLSVESIFAEDWELAD